MKNYLIITLGTRDVQLRKDLIEQSEALIIEQQENPKTSRASWAVRMSETAVVIEPKSNEAFPNYFTFWPRPDGKIIRDNLLGFRPVVELPLVTPIVDFLAQKKINIDCVMLIYTDQQQEYDAKQIQSFHFNNDTLYLKDIATALLKGHPHLLHSEFDEYGIFEQVVNIDHQYQHFGEAQKELLFGNHDEIGQIILLPQGGIDQINHAITLKLIQAFKHKVRLLQKPESSAPAELRFTHYFLNDLNKQKVSKHLNDYDFGLITEELLGTTMPHNVEIYRFAKYAHEKLTLNHDHLSAEFVPEYLLEGTSALTRCRDLYLSAKIQLHKGNYGSYLMKLFTLQENLYRVKCEEIIGSTEGFYQAKYENESELNEPWHQFLSAFRPEIKVKEKTLYESLKSTKFGKYPLRINNPNRYLFRKTYSFLVQSRILQDSLATQNLLKNIDSTLDKLSQKRNEISHGLAPISRLLLVRALKDENELDDLNTNLGQLFELRSPFGIYDSIKSDIEKLL